MELIRQGHNASPKACAFCCDVTSWDSVGPKVQVWTGRHTFDLDERLWNCKTLTETRPHLLTWRQVTSVGVSRNTDSRVPRSYREPNTNGCYRNNVHICAFTALTTECVRVDSAWLLSTTETERLSLNRENRVSHFFILYCTKIFHIAKTLHLEPDFSART